MCRSSVSGPSSRFQSTPSARRATGDVRRLHSCADEISIHALREESDGEVFHLVLLSAKFQSTPSARRATGLGK